MIDKVGGKYIAKVKHNQESLYEKVQEITKIKEPSESYIADCLQQSNEWIKREIHIYTNGCCFYHNKMGHIKTIIKIVKHVEKKDYRKELVSNKTHIQYLIANFYKSAKFFHKKILEHWKVETMHQYKDNSLKEDKHNCYKNPFAMTILRSTVLNLLHLNKIKFINEQLVRNRWNLDNSIQIILKSYF